MSFTYRLVKNLNLNTTNTEEENSSINYLCKDNYVHIRLRDYGNCVEIVSGLEMKLTFLITYILNCSLYSFLDREMLEKIRDKNYYKDIWNTCLGKFFLSKECKALCAVLKDKYETCKGIKILPRYSRKNDYKDALSYIGNINGICLNTQNPLETFLDTLDITIDEYLFNDAISIEITHQTNNKNYCTKYIKKYAIKNEENDLKSRYITLW